MSVSTHEARGLGHPPARHTVMMRNSRWIFIVLLVLGIISLGYSILSLLAPRPGINPAEPFLFGAALIIAAIFIRRRLR